MTKEQPVIHDGPFGWKWIKLAEVAEIKGLSPKETWERFFYWGQEDVLPVVDEGEAHLARVDGSYYSGEGRCDIEEGDFLVLAEWALDILEPQRVAHRTKLHYFKAPLVIGRAYCLAEAILPNGDVVDLPYGRMELFIHQEGRYKGTMDCHFDEPPILLIKALGRGLRDKGLVGHTVDVRIRREEMPDIMVPLQVPLDDPQWWEEWEKEAIRRFFLIRFGP